MTAATTPLIDLSRYAWRRPQGDVTVFGTWSLHNGRPVMVLIPTHLPEHSDHLIPCLVPLDLAYQWDEHTGDPAHCARMTFEFAGALGIDQFNPRNLVRLTSIIRDHLGDLLTMTNLPDSEREVVADAILTDRNTGKVREAEIVDNV